MKKYNVNHKRRKAAALRKELSKFVDGLGYTRWPKVPVAQAPIQLRTKYERDQLRAMASLDAMDEEP